MAIITMYGTKGGAGKTTSTATLLSALAKQNSINGEDEQIKVLALDADHQSSLSVLDFNRKSLGLPDYGITFKKVEPSTNAADILSEYEEEYGLIVIDTPGFFDTKFMSFTMLSDMVLIPTMLDLVELLETTKILNKFSELQEQGHFKGTAASFIAKVEHQNFWNSYHRGQFGNFIQSGYPCLDVMLKRRPAYPNVLNYAEYLFEQVGNKERGASPAPAAEEADAFLNAVANWDLITLNEGGENESVGDVEGGK